VNFFWKNPVEELLIIRKSLKPDGTLFVFYQAPFEIDITAAEPIKQNLLESAFNIGAVHLKKMLPTSAFCIIAKPQ